MQPTVPRSRRPAADPCGKLAESPISSDPNLELIASWQLAIRDHAPGTRELYVRVLGYFTDWLRGGHRADAGLLAVSRHDCEAWFHSMNVLSANTRRTRWVTTSSRSGRLGDSGIDAALHRRARIAGIDGFHVHLLRHAWADLWKSAGGSEEDLRVILRYGAARAVDRALSACDTINPLADL